MWVHRLPVRILPAEQADLPEIRSKFATFLGPM